MSRRLSQHFLFDPGILDRIVDALDPTPTDTVIEVGTGLGTLTQRLAPRVSHVYSIEADNVVIQQLKSVDLKSNVTLVEGSALAVDWSALGPGVEGGHKVVGNIPYHITAPLIERSIASPLPERVVFLVQEEVADRLCASSGTKTYGALTVNIAARAVVTKLFKVRSGSFSPPPKVESAVVRIVPRSEPLVPEDEFRRFRAFVTHLFSQRRKQLRNSLKSLLGDRAVEALDRACVDPQERIERLPPEIIVGLFRAVNR